MMNDLQVGEVDCGIDFFGQVICYQTKVLKGPSIKVVDDHDGDVFIGACYVGIVLCQFGLMAGSSAIPIEATKTALRHAYELESEFTVKGSGVGFENGIISESMARIRLKVVYECLLSIAGGHPGHEANPHLLTPHVYVVKLDLI